MPGPEQILKVTFKNIYIKKVPSLLSSTADLIFAGTIHQSSVPSKPGIDNVTVGDTLLLAESEWSGEVDVSKLEKFDISMSITVSGEKQPLATVTHTVKEPFRRCDFALENAYVRVRVVTEPKVRGKYGAGVNERFLVRSPSQGTITATAVSGNEILYRFEVCPVRPAHDDTYMTGLKRPTILKATPNLNYEVPKIPPDCPINTLPNPSVIPIIPTKKVSKDTAAIIELTYHVLEPKVTKLADDDKRLEWRVVPIGSGAVQFMDSTGKKGLAIGLGPKVYAYGTQEGEVCLELYYKPDKGTKHVLVTKYRALVKSLKVIPFRATILYHELNGNVRIPQSLPEHVVAHIAVTNRILRQIGIELVPDTTKATHTDAKPVVGKDGIFECKTTNIGLTHNVASGTSDSPTPAGVINKKDGVLNIVYIHGFDEFGTKGLAADFPKSNHNQATMSDGGSPSSSWISPSGVWPDGDAGTIAMGFLDDHQRDAKTLAILMSNTSCWHDPHKQKVDPFAGLSADARTLRGIRFKRCSTYRMFRRKTGTGKHTRVHGQPYPLEIHSPDWTLQRWQNARAELDRPMLAPPTASGAGGDVGIQHFGVCLVHEVGHVLNLRHRVDGAQGMGTDLDGLEKFNAPKGRNVMGYGSPYEHLDLDIIQARLAHQSPVLQKDTRK